MLPVPVTAPLPPPPRRGDARADPAVAVFIHSPHPIVRSGAAALIRDARHPLRVLDTPPRVDVRLDLDRVVVVYDVVGLATGDGADLDRLIAAGVAVVALGRSLHPQLAAYAVARGAVATVPMSVDGDRLADALRHALVQFRTMPGVPGARPVQDELDWHLVALGVLESSGVVLTPRQAQVLDALVSGARTADVANELHISPNTVKTYVRTTYRLLGVQNRSEAVAWAQRHGLGPQARPTAGSWSG